MKEKVDSVLKLLNINLDNKDNKSQSEYEKFLSRFKSIFQDYFSLIFVFNEEFCNKIKNKLLITVNSYKIEFKEKLEDLESDLNKKPFKTLIENLFKLCIYMKLHDPILQHNIKNNEDRIINYVYYNKNEYMNIEGFGTELTPCAIIVTPPMLRNSFAYMGIKPAVYCLQKSQVNEDIISQCEKNKQLERNRSLSKDSKINNESNKNNSENKNNNFNSAKKSVSNNENIKKIINLTNENNINNNSLIKTTIKNNIPIHVTKINVTNILTQNSQNENLEENKKYDKPLIMKAPLNKPEDIKLAQNKKSVTGSFIEKEKLLDSSFITNNNLDKRLNLNNTINIKNNSRASSIGENEINSEKINNKGINFTKTTLRLFKNNQDSDANNTHTTPLRFIPTNTQTSQLNSFNVIRSKNTKQSYISDTGKIKIENSLEDESNEKSKTYSELNKLDKNNPTHTMSNLNLNIINSKKFEINYNELSERIHMTNNFINSGLAYSNLVRKKVANTPNLNRDKNNERNYISDFELKETDRDNFNLDMKYNVLKKETNLNKNYNSNNRDVEFTPNYSKVSKHNYDIKTKVGKYYNKVLNSGNTPINSNSNNINLNINKLDNHINHINYLVNNSPKSNYTSNYPDKSTKGKTGTSYFTSFPNKIVRK